MNPSPRASGADPYAGPTLSVEPPVALTTQERISRLVLGIEALVLLLPLSALAAWLAIATTLVVSRRGVIGPDPRVLAAIAAGCCIVLAAMWWPVGAYLRSGRAGLARMPRWPLVLLDVAAVAMAAGCVLWALDSYTLAGVPAWAEPMEVGVLGSPVLVPWLHLAVERWRSRAAR